MRNYIEQAISEALKSHLNYKVGCILLDRKGNIVSRGYNIGRTHPLQAAYARKVNEHHKIYLHAEIHALVKCRVDPYHAVVIRIGKLGVVRGSRPCPICTYGLRVAGVKRITYAEKDGTIREETI
jgi:tRNA(Arg) A34 adenosine deaminase TadA